MNIAKERGVTHVFAGWVMTIAAMGVLSALLEALLPEGPLRKTALVTIGLVTLVAIASPLNSLLAGVGAWTN